MNLVVAGSYRQYIGWLNANRLSQREFQYVGDLENLRGVCDCTIYLVGNYYESELFNSPCFWDIIISKHNKFCIGREIF